MAYNLKSWSNEKLLQKTGESLARCLYEQAKCRRRGENPLKAKGMIYQRKLHEEIVTREGLAKDGVIFNIVLSKISDIAKDHAHKNGLYHPRCRGQSVSIHNTSEGLLSPGIVPNACGQSKDEYEAKRNNLQSYIDKLKAQQTSA